MSCLNRLSSSAYISLAREKPDCFFYDCSFFSPLKVGHFIPFFRSIYFTNWVYSFQNTVMYSVCILRFVFDSWGKLESLFFKCQHLKFSWFFNTNKYKTYCIQAYSWFFPVRFICSSSVFIWWIRIFCFSVKFFSEFSFYEFRIQFFRRSLLNQLLGYLNLGAVSIICADK